MRKSDEPFSDKLTGVNRVGILPRITLHSALERVPLSWGGKGFGSASGRKLRGSFYHFLIPYSIDVQHARVMYLRWSPYPSHCM